MLSLAATIAGILSCCMPDVSWGRIGTSGTGVSIRHIVSMRPAVVPVMEKLGGVGEGSIDFLVPIKAL